MKTLQCEIDCGGLPKSAVAGMECNAGQAYSAACTVCVAFSLALLPLAMFALSSLLAACTHRVEHGGLCMANVQEAARLGREACHHRALSGALQLKELAC